MQSLAHLKITHVTFKSLGMTQNVLPVSELYLGKQAWKRPEDILRYTVAYVERRYTGKPKHGLCLAQFTTLSHTSSAVRTATFGQRDVSKINLSVQNSRGDLTQHITLCSLC
jgi:hypothetical protein